MFLFARNFVKSSLNAQAYFVLEIIYLEIGNNICIQIRVTYLTYPFCNTRRSNNCNLTFMNVKMKR